jgi:hypothetical protein
VIGQRGATAIALGVGVVAVLLAMAAGVDAVLIDRIVRPPAIIRAALVGGSATLTVLLLARALSRLAAGTDDVPGMVRGVRLAFLALAAGSAGAGWALGDPLPLIVGLVIAGIDVVETSFLLLVVGASTEEPGPARSRSGRSSEP